MLWKLSIASFIAMNLFSCKTNQPSNISEVLATRSDKLDPILVCRIGDNASSFEFIGLGGRADQFAITKDSADQTLPCYQPLNLEKRYSKDCFANVQGRKNVKTGQVSPDTAATLFSWYIGGGVWERYLVNLPSNWSTRDEFDGFIKLYSAAPANLRTDLSKDRKAVTLHCEMESMRENE